MSTDAAGAVIHNQRYTAFGSTRNPAIALDRYLGRELDVETGLLHLGARYYAPSLGRFISPDWWVLENPNKPARMPQGFNVYGYALNNPLVFKDPSGMWFGIDDLIVAAVGFVVGFRQRTGVWTRQRPGLGQPDDGAETGLTTAAGAWLGWTVAGPFGALMGGMNGLFSGVHGIYDWGSVDGWFAFLSDSTWGLIGTTLGNVVHVINLFGNSGYREDLSRRQNRHVYEGGFYLKEGIHLHSGQRHQQRGPERPGYQRELHRQSRGAARLAAALLRPLVPDHLRCLGHRRASSWAPSSGSPIPARAGAAWWRPPRTTTTRSSTGPTTTTATGRRPAPTRIVALGVAEADSGQTG